MCLVQFLCFLMKLITVSDLLIDFFLFLGQKLNDALGISKTQQ